MSRDEVPYLFFALLLVFFVLAWLTSEPCAPGDFPGRIKGAVAVSFAAAFMLTLAVFFAIPIAGCVWKWYRHRRPGDGR